METICLLHGLGQSNNAWAKTSKLLKKEQDERKICLLAPDLSQFVFHEPLTYGYLYATFEEYLNKQCRRWGKITLCGLSLGAVLALNYACNYPDHIRKLVLLAPQFAPDPKIIKMQNVLFSVFGSPKSDGFSSSQVKSLCKSMADIDLSEQVSGLHFPTIIMVGEKDKANRKAAMELHELMDNSVIKIVNDSRHEINKERPEVLIPYLLSI